MSIEATFGPAETAAARTLITVALMEDLGDRGDLTCLALIRPEDRAVVNVVARKPGVLAGSPIGRMVFAQFDPSITWEAHRSDGERLAPDDVVATVSGPLNALLVGERTMLNFLTHLSGVATLTRRFVDAIASPPTVILDTRKTLPGYRRLEKYAVRCGGGVNHRMGLYDGVLIKDNHLAAWTVSASIAAAIETARAASPPGVSIEVEVDTLDQLRDALCGRPDIVLLDNMDPAMLRAAVAIRDEFCDRHQSTAKGQTLPTIVPLTASRSGSDDDSPRPKTVLLEASGGISLENVRAVAETGVERISIGALTHSAPALDLAFDWANRIV